MLSINIRLNKNPTEPLYLQIKKHIRTMIINKNLPPGTKLPSYRKLARFLKVSKNTVLNAYDELRAEGFINSIMGSGFYVYNENDYIIKNNSYHWILNSSRYAGEPDQFTILRKIKKLKITKDHIIFVNATIPESCYPVKETQDVIEEIKQNISLTMDYSPPEGIRPLREIIAERLTISGERVSFKNILITNGAQQALFLLMNSILEPGSRIIVENPTYVLIPPLSKILGLKIIPVSVDQDGMNVDELEKVVKVTKPKLIYTISNCHNPTSTIMSIERKEKLIKISKKYEIPMIDDKTYSEIYFDKFPPVSLGSLDHSQNIMEVGSFSKSVFPGWRIGWLVAPDKIIEKIKWFERIVCICVPTVTQMFFQKFVEKGYYDRHILNLRKIYEIKRNVMFQSIKKYFPRECKCLLPMGGQFFWVRIPRIDALKLAEMAFEKKILLFPGQVFFVENVKRDFIRLDFTYPTIDQIKTGIRMLSDLISNVRK